MGVKRAGSACAGCQLVPSSVELKQGAELV